MKTRPTGVEFPHREAKRQVSMKSQDQRPAAEIQYKSIPHTQIKNTLKYYNEWWDKVYGHIKDDVNRIILRRNY